jgi:multidrug resistance efflux pump
MHNPYHNQVIEGQLVEEGAPLVAVEAMKTEHVVRAPLAGRVVGLRAAQGAQVGEGHVLTTVVPLPKRMMGRDGGEMLKGKVDGVGRAR